MYEENICNFIQKFVENVNVVEADPVCWGAIWWLYTPGLDWDWS